MVLSAVVLRNARSSDSHVSPRGILQMPGETEPGSAGTQPGKGYPGRRCANGASGLWWSVSLGAVFFCLPLDTGAMPWKILRRSRTGCGWAVALPVRSEITCFALFVCFVSVVFVPSLTRDLVVAVFCHEACRSRSFPCGCTPIHLFVDPSAHKQPFRLARRTPMILLRPSRGRRSRLNQTYARLVGRVHGLGQAGLAPRGSSRPKDRRSMQPLLPH